MKSIRLSLVLYFLALLALALGAVSALVYWNTAEAVAARQSDTRKLLKEQYDRRCGRERRNLDNALLIQARTLANLAQLQFQSSRQYLLTLEPLGILSASLGPEGHLQVPVWVAVSSKGPLAYRIFRLATSEIEFDEEDLPRFVDERKPETDVVIAKYLAIPKYFQINSEWGNRDRSQSMEIDDLAFPFDPEQFAAIRMFDAKFDDHELRPGLKVRRVMLKAPVVRFRTIGQPLAKAPLRPPSLGQEPIALLIHTAAETTIRDHELQQIQQEHQQELAQLEEESAAALASLRWRLGAIALLTFALTVAGGFALVRLGLLPLQRLSEAVSRVSEKDFRLQFDEPNLPAELRPIVERLTQTLGQLQRAFTREKQATADISHELRTPLAALLTTTEFALRKQRPAEEYRQLLADCRSIAQQLTQQVERLLVLARLDAGVDTLRPQPVDVASLARQCADLVRPLAEARELTLEFRQSGPAVLATDADKLREVLTNLLHNAIEYNRPHGRVDLLVKRDNGRLQVEVHDTGIGISPEAQAQIFQRFYRADPSRQDAGLHAGLGLAIVKGYVSLMGGTISVESTPGQGSTFRVSLPVGDKVASDDQVTR
jgi:heavy metal sensor kinase